MRLESTISGVARQSRRSACAAQSRQREMERLREMSVAARIEAALTMSARFWWRKLYAGGYKSKADIVELLARNPDLDLNEVRAVCERHRLTGLDELIADAR